MASQPNNEDLKKSKSSGIYLASSALVAEVVANPLFLVGGVFGVIVGWAICWLLFVLPFRHNLAEREAQLENWSKLNMQMQMLAMENRSISQAELKQFVAANQEASAAFLEVQKQLQEREIRLTETPTGMVALALAVCTVAFGGTVVVIYMLNQRALMTVDQVVGLAPRELVEEVVRRHAVAAAPHYTPLPSPKDERS